MWLKDGQGNGSDKCHRQQYELIGSGMQYKQHIRSGFSHNQPYMIPSLIRDG